MPKRARKTKPAPLPSEQAPVIVIPPSPNLAVSVLRREDLLALRFEFINLNFSPGGGAKRALVRADASKAAFIVVHFPQQNIAEQAFFESAKGKENYTLNSVNKQEVGKTDVLDELPVKSRISGPSRLVFKVPPNADPVPYTLQALLEKCSEYELSVAPVALPPQKVKRVEVLLRWMPGRSNLQAQPQPQATAAGTASAEQLIAQMRAKVWAKKSVLARRGPQVDDAKLSQQLATFTIKPKLASPKLHETAIEAPYRLIVSPNKYAVWEHLTTPPKTTGVAGRVELWHTRLASWVNDRFGRRRSEDDDALRTVRAIWATDPEFVPDRPVPQPVHTNKPFPFRMSLDATDRHNIVHLSSNFLFPGQSDYTPLPIEVDQFILSALGAWMNTHGAWTPPDGLTVRDWRHRGTMGRDHYVRVVIKGYLCPLGNAASLVIITERKFHGDKPGNPAYLRQRMFLVPTQPEIYYGSPDPAWPAKYDRQFPFTRVRITTLVTPNLDPPEAIKAGPDVIDLGQTLFWPKVGGEDFLFHCIAEGLDGEEVEFDLPLLFADASVAKDAKAKGIMNKALANYMSPMSKTRRQRPLHGQAVMLAPSNKPGATSFEVDNLTFGFHVGIFNNQYGLGERPAFYPCLVRAQIFIPAVKHLTGTSELSDIEYHPLYLSNGFDGNNKGQVFAKLPSDAKATTLDFSNKGDRSGGLVQPNIQIKGLSRTLGPVSGNVDTLAGTGAFAPDDFFSGLTGDLLPKIFGCIELADILEGAGVAMPERMPKFVTETLDVVESFLNDAAAFQNDADKLKAAGGSIATLATSLTTDINNILSHAKPETLAAFLAALNSFKANAASLAAALPAVNNINADVKREAQRRLDQFNQLLADASFLDDVKNFVNAVELAKEMRVKFEWQPKLTKWPKSGKPLFIASNNGAPAMLLIVVEMRAKTGGASKPGADIFCSLENFTLDLVAPSSFIKLYFDKLQFFASAGKKPDINVVLGKLEFVGVLSFVEALRSIIPLDGFSDPPALDVTEQGIAASYSLGLPTLAVGIFSLQNLSLGAGFTVPFIGDPLSVRFNFCERQSPFMLTVMMFGGGGFFALTLDPQGVQILEAAFEFGASISVDFGVASGGVKVVAGIYFKLAADEAELTGYLELAGYVEVLGIVSVSIELYLELHYEFASGKCVGRATLTLEIEIAFFSKTVEISCERKFAGSNGDPTFAQVMGPEPALNPTSFPWRDYCQAFA